MKVDFNFDIDDKVKIKPLGVAGVVSTCSVNEDHGQSFYVKTANGGDWYPSRQLVKIEDGE